MDANTGLSRPQLRIALNSGAYAYPFGCGLFKHGNILLVADEHNPPDRYAYINQPFAGVLSPCSVWLNDQLDKAGIDETKMFWVNAKMHNGQWVDLRHLVYNMQPSQIIALGWIASDRLDQVLIRQKHHTVQHPQYWKRFKSKLPYPLIPLLQQFIKEMP